jgi:hypothetical protein
MADGTKVAPVCEARAEPCQQISALEWNVMVVVEQRKAFHFDNRCRQTRQTEANEPGSLSAQPEREPNRIWQLMLTSRVGANGLL